MERKLFHFFAAGVFFFFAVGCNHKDVLDPGDGFADTRDVFYYFGSKTTLRDYLEMITSGTLTRSEFSDVVRPDGFVSLHERIERMKASTRVGSTGGVDEVTKDEYAVYRAMDLLVEPALYHVLDTSMIISVGDRIYKVCDAGTFVFPVGYDGPSMRRYIASADMGRLSSLSKGEEVSLGDGVSFIRTFGEMTGDDGFEVLPPEDGTRSYNLSGSLHSGYNCTTYRWTANSVVQNILEFLLVKDYVRYADLDDKHRFAVHVYNNNFGFIEAAGVKSWVQVKKKFLFVNYWVADGGTYDIVSGFNYLYSEHRNFMKAGSFASYMPSSLKGYSSFSSDITGVGSVSFLYGDCQGVPYVSGLGSKMNLVLPYMYSNGVNLTSESKQTLEKLFGCGQASQLMGVLKTAASKMGRSDAPSLLFLPKPSSSSEFKNDLTLLYGRAEKRTDCFDITLLLKGGFSWSGGPVPAPIQFNTYYINALDTFASVKYNGKWTGVRFVFN